MAFDITLLGGSSFQLDLTLAPSGKGVFPCQWQLDLQFCVFSLSGRGLHLVRAHCGVCAAVSVHHFSLSCQRGASSSGCSLRHLPSWRPAWVPGCFGTQEGVVVAGEGSRPACLDQILDLPCWPWYEPPFPFF